MPDATTELRPTMERAAEAVAAVQRVKPLSSTTGYKSGLTTPWVRKYDDALALEASDLFVAISVPAPEALVVFAGEPGDTPTAIEPGTTGSPVPAVQGLVPNGEPTEEVVFDPRHLRRLLDALAPDDDTVIRMRLYGFERAIVFHAVDTNAYGADNADAVDERSLGLLMPMRGRAIAKDRSDD